MKIIRPPSSKKCFLCNSLTWATQTAGTNSSCLQSCAVFWFVWIFMSRIDWFINFTSENFKKTTAKILTKGFGETICGIGNNLEGAYAFLKLSLMNEFNLQADTKSIAQTHTVCTTQVDKNRQNRTFYSGVGGWITGLQHFLNITLYNGVGCRTTGLQTLF